MSIVLTILGIVGPSVVLVAALRRWIAPVPWSLAWLFLALTLAFQHGAVFTTKLPVPVDEVARGYPYRGVVGPVQPRNPLTNDDRSCESAPSDSSGRGGFHRLSSSGRDSHG